MTSIQQVFRNIDIRRQIFCEKSNKRYNFDTNYKAVVEELQNEFDGMRKFYDEMTWDSDDMGLAASVPLVSSAPSRYEWMLEHCYDSFCYHSTLFNDM